MVVGRKLGVMNSKRRTDGQGAAVGRGSAKKGKSYKRGTGQTMGIKHLNMKVFAITILLALVATAYAGIISTGWSGGGGGWSGGGGGGWKGGWSGGGGGWNGGGGGWNGGGGGKIIKVISVGGGGWPSGGGGGWPSGGGGWSGGGGGWKGGWSNGGGGWNGGGGGGWW